MLTVSIGLPKQNAFVRRRRRRTAPLKTVAALCFVLFVAVAPSVWAQNPPLILLSETTSTRAIAFDSVEFTKEPFSVNSLLSWSTDHRTRVIVFALNLEPGPLTDLSADAEDFSHRHYDLKVEQAGPVSGQEWMSAITLRLNDNLTDVGDVLIRVKQKSRQSNRVRVAIGHVGGGLADDIGAKPTSPFLIRGLVTSENAGFPSAVLTLTGEGTETTSRPNDKGQYLIATVGGNYVLSAGTPFFDFSPSSFTFTDLNSALEGINFSAARQTRGIAGVLRDDSGNPIPNVEIRMSGSDQSQRTLYTDNQGRFGFVQIPCGFAYTITPANNSIFTFTPQTIDPLSDNNSLEFLATRRLYDIAGRILDGTTQIAGVKVALQTGATTTTSSDGRFLFPALRAGFDYTISLSKDDYVFEPASQIVESIQSNRELSLQGHPHVFLTGRVADPNGRGIYGVKLEVSGTQSGLATTDIDGKYSFLVTAFGNYQIRPWKEQDYYSFSPANTNVTALPASRTADFTGALNASVSPSYVLEFDGAPKTVDYSMTLPGPDYNLFWQDSQDFGHFLWEFWAMAGENAGGTYMISDGYGGAHAILFGFSTFGAKEPNRYQLLGNIWNGSFLTYFSTDEGPAPNEWAHFAAGWDGSNIVVYFNGIPVGKTAWTGPRITPGGIQGCGRLLIGGSDHSNLVGRIAQLRGFERRNPLEAVDKGVFNSFAPETVFSVEGNMLSYFFRPAENIADLSLFGQFGRQHPGLVRSTANGVLFNCSGCPVPEFVLDPTAPDFAHPDNPGTIKAPVDNPGTPPVGALIYDSFSRANSTYVLNGVGGLGNTEAGTAGSRPWLTDVSANQPHPFGILNGRGVLLAKTAAVTWTSAPANSADLDVRVERHAGYWGTGHNTGLSFRVADANNYFFAYTTSVGDESEVLTVGYYRNGVRTDIESGISLPTDWTTLRVITHESGPIGVYAGATLLFTSDASLFATAPGVGLYNSGPGRALTNRWDNFTVFPAP